jgi:protoheme IX farnesyltransferase
MTPFASTESGSSAFRSRPPGMLSNEAGDSAPRSKDSSRTWPSALRDFATLCKLRVNVLVLATTAAAFVLALPRGSDVDLSRLISTLIGVFVLAASSSALNQYIERRHDQRMVRTANRPLAAERLAAEPVRWLATMFTAGGILFLGIQVHWLPAFLGFVTVALYAGLYTPLKRRSPISLHIGAIAGGLPPLMGATAACGEIELFGLVLFVLLFLWQLPHFHAIAWIHRDDYARGGFRLLAVVRPQGGAVAIESVVAAILLVAVSAIPLAADRVRGFGAEAAVGATLLFLIVTGCFALRRTRTAARCLLFSSLIYLPAILGLWIVGSREF